MKLTHIFFMISCMIPQAASGQFVNDVSKAGTTVASFLEIGISSRAVAMGEAFAAVGTDVTAVYWNPAGLAYMRNGGVALHHINWFTDVAIDNGMIAWPITGFGTLAVSLTTLNMGEMEVRTIAQPEGTGELFGANDLAVGLTYARSLTDRFSMGGTVKYVRQTIWNMNATTFAFDLGTMFKLPVKNMQLGMSVSNFGSDLQLQGDDAVLYVDIAPEKYGSNNRLVSRLDMSPWALPLNFRAGLAYDLRLARGNRLTLAVDALHPNNNTESINLGGEYALREIAFLRAGYKSLLIRDGVGGASFGGGLRTKVSGLNMQLDYSYTDHGWLQNAQRFSLNLEF